MIITRVTHVNPSKFMCIYVSHTNCVEPLRCESLAMAEADSVIQSIEIVADKLQKKALDADARGDRNISKSLLSSVQDLHNAAKFVHTQQQQLSSFQSLVDTSSQIDNRSLQELLEDLSGVTLMLEKKSEEMRRKSNENASKALQNASCAVTKASNVIRCNILDNSTLEQNIMRLDQLELEMRQHLEAHSYKSNLDDTKSFDAIASIQQHWKATTTSISVLESRIETQQSKNLNSSNEIDAEVVNGNERSTQLETKLKQNSTAAFNRYNPWEMQLEDLRSVLVCLEVRESKALTAYKSEIENAAQTFYHQIENCDNCDKLGIIGIPKELQSLSVVQQKFEKLTEENLQINESISIIKNRFHATFNYLFTEWTAFGWATHLKEAFAQSIDQNSIEMFAKELNRMQKEFELCWKNINGEHQMLIQELTQALNRISKLEQHVLHVQNQCTCLEMAIEDAHSHILSEKVSTDEERVNVLTFELEKLKMEFEKYRKRSHAALCKMEKRSKVIELEKERELLLQKCRNLEETIKVERERAMELDKAMNRQFLQHEDSEGKLYQAMVDMNAENEKLIDEIGDWRGQVQMQTQTEASLQAEWRKCEANWTEKSASWTMEIELLRMKTQDVESALIENDDRCDFLRRQVDMWILREKEWATTRAEMTLKCDQLTDEIATQIREIASLKNENHLLVQTRLLEPPQSDQSALISHSEEMKVLRRELEAHRSAQYRLQTRYDEAVETIHIKAAVIDGLLTEYERFQMRQEDLQSICWHLESLVKHSDSCQPICDSNALQLEISHLEETLERLQLEMLHNDRKIIDEMRQSKSKAEHRSRQLTLFTSGMNAKLSHLQTILESYASLFHQSTECQANRDGTHSSVDDIIGAENAQTLKGLLPAVSEPMTDTNLYEDALVMRSGVTIKAGAVFSLPVVCDLIGSRVLWSFSIDDEADVGFTCVATRSNSESSDHIIVHPCRVNSLEDSLTIESPMTLIFEWDNTFSWINAKTMDYQVVIQQLLPPEQQFNQEKIQALQRHHTRLLNEKAIFEEEKSVRQSVRAALTQVMDDEAEKTDCMETWKTHWDNTQALMINTQEKLELWKNLLNTYVVELDEVDKCSETLSETWNGVLEFKEDAETMLKFSEGPHFAAICDDIARELAYTESMLDKLQQEKLEPIGGLN